MTVWLDAQLPPSLAAWMRTSCGVDATPVKAVGLRDATDEVIFAAARQANVVEITKDMDFVGLLERHGPPPAVVWLRCGNTSNARLRELLSRTWPEIQALLSDGERLVEVTDPW